MMNEARELWKMVRSSADPEGLTRQLAAKNPELREIMNEKSPKAAFYKKCAKLGVNPEQFISEMMR